MLYGTGTSFTAAKKAGKQVLQLPSPGPHDNNSLDSQIIENLELSEELASELDELDEQETKHQDEATPSTTKLTKRTQRSLGPVYVQKPGSSSSKDSKTTSNTVKEIASMSRNARNNYSNDVHAFNNPQGYPDLTSSEDEDLEDLEDLEDEDMEDEDDSLDEESFDDITAGDEDMEDEDEEMDEDELEAMSADLQALGSELEAAEEAAESEGDEMSEDDDDLEDDFEVNSSFDEDELELDEEAADVTEEELDEMLGNPLTFASQNSALSSDVTEEELDDLLDDSEIRARIEISYDEIDAAETCAAEADEDEEETEDDEDLEDEDLEDDDLEDEEDLEDEDLEDEELEDDEEDVEEASDRRHNGKKQRSYASDDADMSDQITEIDLSEATEIEEDDEVAVAHVTSSTGQQYWQLMCNDIPLATLKPGQLKGPLKAVANDRLNNQDFNTALVNTIRAAGTDAIHVASSIGFKGITLPDIVMPSIDRAVEARVVEDQRLNMKGWLRDMQVTAAAINKGFYPDAANPLAINLTKVLASVGVGNAASIVKAALAEAFEPFMTQVLAKTVEFRANPPEAQRAIAAAVGQMKMLSSDDENDGENADVMSYEGDESNAPDDLSAMMEESSDRQNRGRATASSGGNSEHLTVEAIRALFNS